MSKFAVVPFDSLSFHENTVLNNLFTDLFTSKYIVKFKTLAIKLNKKRIIVSKKGQ